MKPHPSQNSGGAFSVRLMAGIAAAFLLPVLLFAAPPSWWAARNVTNGNQANDYAAVNQGQLKTIATAAFNELSANLPGGVGDMTAPSGTFPGGTGYRLTALINGWSITQSGTLVETPGANTNDYSAVNLGQLKNVASLFYNRLIEVGYTGQYPWLSSTNAPNDYAAANIGQVKNLFSFDVTYDSDSNGLPDWWEMYYFGSIGQSGTSLAPSGNGLTILQSYQDNVSPVDYYNGVSPALAIVSGTNQTGAPGALLSAPLVVQVTGTSGLPMVNAPVTFVVTEGVGVLAPDNSGTSSMSTILTALTGANGYAQVWFQQPFDASFTSAVAAYAESREVDFSETTSADTNPPAAPSNVAATIQSDGSVLVTWTDNSDNETGFTVETSDDGGTTWTPVATVGPDITSLDIDPSAASGITGSTLINCLADGPPGTTPIPAATPAPAQPQIVPIPTIMYLPMDISSGPATTGSSAIIFGGTDTPAPTSDVISTALGDDNKASYCYISGSDTYTFYGLTFYKYNEVTVNTWASGTTVNTGTILSNGATPITFGTSNGTMTEYLSIGDTFFYNSPGTNPPENPLPPDGILLLPPQIDNSGILETSAYGTVTESYPSYPGWILANGYCWSSPSIRLSGSKQYLEFNDGNLITGTAQLITSNTNGIASNLGVGASVLLCSQAGYGGVGYFADSNFASNFDDPESDMFRAAYICLTGTTLFYINAGNNANLSGSLPGDITAIPTLFIPVAMNDGGVVIGTGSDGAYYWDESESNPIILGTSTVATAINNQNMAVGYSAIPGNPHIGMLWQMNYSETQDVNPIQMQSLLPPPYKNEVQGLIPLAISNVNSNNRVSIVCSGTVLESSGTANPPPPPVVTPETIIFQVDASNPTQNPQIFVAKASSGINFQNTLQPMIKSINQNGVIAAIGDLQNIGIKHAILLLPVQFNVLSWNPQIQPPNPDVQLMGLNNAFSSCNIAKGNQETFDVMCKLQAQVAGAPAGIPAVDAEVSQWKVKVLQDLVAYNPEVVTYNTSKLTTTETPVPGEDLPGDGFPEAQFSRNMDIESGTYGDSPGDTTISLWATYPPGPNGIGQLPLKGVGSLMSVSRDSTFITWIYVERSTGERQYIKWVKWRVAYEVDFQVSVNGAATKATFTKPTWIFKELDEGDGVGSASPNFQKFQQNSQFTK